MIGTTQANIDSRRKSRHQVETGEEDIITASLGVMTDQALCNPSVLLHISQHIVLAVLADKRAAPRQLLRRSIVFNTDAIWRHRTITRKYPNSATIIGADQVRERRRLKPQLVAVVRAMPYSRM